VPGVSVVVPTRDRPPTSNLAARAELLRAEPFDERFPEAAGEDREWCARISRAGYRLRREPRAVVVHHQRLDLRGFARQQLRYGRGAHEFRRRHGTEPAAFHAGLLRAGFRRGAVSGTLVLLAQAMVGAGLVRARLSDR
jgi:GT2 family glycosyltransferase